MKGAEDLSDFLHVALDFLVMICVWSARGPPPKVAFDPAHNPGIVLYGKQKGPRLTNAPIQVLYPHLLGLSENAWVFSMEHALQCLTCIKTVFGQSNGMLVVNHCVLVGDQ